MASLSQEFKDYLKVIWAVAVFYVLFVRKFPPILFDIPSFIIYQAPTMYQLLSEKGHITFMLKTCWKTAANLAFIIYGQTENSHVISKLGSLPRVPIGDISKSASFFFFFFSFYTNLFSWSTVFSLYTLLFFFFVCVPVHYFLR